MVQQFFLRQRPIWIAAIATLASVGVLRADDWRPPLAIVHGTIVTGTGTRIESGTVLIRDGRIVGVGKKVEIPADAETLDAAGLYVYPGWIDAHTFLGIPDDKRTTEARERLEDLNPDRREGPLPETRFANRRGVRSHLRAAELFQVDEKKLTAHRDFGFAAAMIAPRDGIFGGTGALIDLSGAPIRRALLVPDVAMHCSFTTGEDGEYPRTLLGVFAQFRQVLLDAQHHSKLQKFAERHPTTSPRVPVDPALESLKPVLSGKRLVIFEANLEREIHRALNLADEFGLRIAISGAKEAYKVIDRIKEARVPLIVSLKFDREPDYGKKKKEAKEKKSENEAEEDESSKESDDAEEEKDKQIYEPLKVRQERRRLWEEHVHNAVALHEAGLSFAFRTRDFDSTKNFFKNLRLVMERGLPEDAAVAALTAAPADLCGMGRQLGTIERDRIAHLTILDAPLGEKKAKVKYVLIAGKKFEVKDDSKKKDKTEEKDKKDAPKEPAEEALTETADDKGPTFASEIDADRFPSRKTGGNILIQGATIIPITGPTIERGSILIQDGKITQIASNIEPPAGVMVIDGSGRFVIPGFVDAHSHLGLNAVNEGPLAISAEVRIGDVINPTHKGIYRAAAGGTTTHHTMHGSANPIGGQNATWKLKYKQPIDKLMIEDAARTIKFATGENVIQSNRQKAWGKRYPNTRMGVESVYRQALEAAKTYHADAVEWERKTEAGMDLPPIRRDLRLEALAEILTGDLTIHAHCYRSEEILRLLNVAEDYGFRIGTLHHVLEGYRIAPELARHGCGASTFANDWAYKVEAYGAIPYNAAMMTSYGINVTVNSDSANTIRYLGQEAAKSVRWGGLDEIAALKLVTINAARQLGVDHRVGSLEVGKDGDLAIFNGHPLNTFSKCVMTIIDGAVVFEDARPEPVTECGEFHHPGIVSFDIPQTVHRAFAIVGATVHPITSPPIEGATVVILEDRVQAVGKDVQIPPGAGVIDGKGLHVYPGLIDAGSRLGLNEIDSLRATRDDGEIGTFNPQLLTASAVHPHSEHIRIARTGGTTTALCTPWRGRISGQSSIIRLDGWTTPEMLVDEAFALHMTVPSLPVHMPEDKDKTKKLKEEHEAATKKLTEFFDKARHYAKVKKLAETEAGVDLPRDLRLDAMVPYIRGEKPVALAASQYKQILDTIEFAEKQKLRWVLLGGRECWKLADTLAEKKIPVILDAPTGYPRGDFEPWDSVYRCAGVLQRAGVRFCFASNSASMAYNLGLEVGMAVAHGLPQADAEYALTMGAATIMGLSDRLGSIEAGKQADLIVTTDSPLQAGSVVTHMFIAGAPIELTSMHTESYEKFRNRPKPKLPPPAQLVGPASQTTP